ncbi:RNA polymerase sigma factor [Engelhardtia mirabilis]
MVADRLEGGAEDLLLAQRALACDLEAQEALAIRLRCVARFVAERNRRLGSPLGPEGIEEVSQTVVLQVWKRLDQFRGRARIETWTYAFCRNETMNAARRLQRERSRTLSLAALEGPLEPSVAMAVHQGAVDQGLVDDDIEALLAHLAAREAQVVRLRHIDDRTLPEIALLLGLSVSSIKTHYYRGLTKLRALLEPIDKGDRL